MKILIVNRFFGGAQIPTGRMAEDVARIVVEDGHEVVALASSGKYAGAVAQARDNGTTGLQDNEAKRPKDEKTSEQRPEFGDRRSEMGSAQSGELRVEKVRVPKWMPRALAWVWFTWQARQRIPRMDWDVCVLMTDPPLLPLLAAKAACGEWRVTSDECTETEQQAKHRAKQRIAVWLMDLYPEALAASGRITKGNPLYKWYFNKRQQSLAAADLLICLGHAQEELLDNRRQEPGDKGQGGARSKALTHGNTKPPLTQRVRTVVVPPWDDRGNIALATEESLKNLALYAGNLGEAHCFEEILAAAPCLPSDWTIRFAVRGAKLGALKEKAKGISHRLTRIYTDSFSAGDTGGKSLPRESTAKSGAAVHVSGYATEEETPGLLASARVHLITMSPSWEGIVVPSKLYGCIRTGRPVLFIGPENADTAREICAHDWGKVLPPGASGEEVASAILELAARPTRAADPRNGALEIVKLLETLATAKRSETDNLKS